MQNYTLPQGLIISLGTESQDFSVKAGRAQPLKKTISTIFSGIVFIAFSLYGLVFMPGSGSDGEVLKNLSSLSLSSLLFLGTFISVGLFILFIGISMLFKKGGYFVGTPTRLVQFQKGSIKSIDWEQFTGNIELKSNGQSGSLLLELRTGKKVSRKRDKNEYVPDVVYISNIQNVYEVEKICRQRIKENDPTPRAS